MSVTMTYGAYSFSPVPSLSYSRAAERTPGKNFCLSTPVVIELNGSVVTTGFQNVVELMQQLNNTFKCGTCQTFKVQCDSESPWFNGPARVTNFSVQPRNEGDLYVNTASYSISLEMVSTTGFVYDNQPSGISAISEEWNIEFMDERVAGTSSGIDSGTISIAAAYNISHAVTVTAPFACSGGDGINIAKTYLVSNFSNPDPNNAKSSGIFFPSSLFYYNHYRVINQNIYEGTVSLNETWVATNDNKGALEEFDANVSISLDSNLATVSINGTIQGLASITYPGASGTPKLSNAVGYWHSTVKNALYSRANTVYDSSLFSGRSLNTIPVTRSYGYNTVAGTVTYNYEYNNRPVNCVANALAENITITESNPNDIFASLTVLGRANGPLYQQIGTIGPRTREIAIEAVLPVGTGCSFAAFTAPTDYDSLIGTYETGLYNAYDQVFVNSETKTWNPKEGRFTFNKSWTVGECQ